MTDDVWIAVDHYFDGALTPADPALSAALTASEVAGLPGIQVSAAQGKHLHLLAQSIRARRILEIGTLGGYSTIWLARALQPDGELITLEVDPHHAEVARGNIDNAALSDRVEIRTGPALETLPELAGPFDFIFIDADKPNNAGYFAHALRLSRSGTMIVVDNVVRNGAVVDATNGDAAVQGTRRLVEAVAAEPRVSATAIQTVGVKGYDGFALARITS
jgi:predicted O-methyltransferase YrrM